MLLLPILPWLLRLCEIVRVWLELGAGQLPSGASLAWWPPDCGGSRRMTRSGCAGGEWG